MNLISFFRQQKPQPDIIPVCEKAKQKRRKDGPEVFLKKLREFPSAKTDDKVFAGNDYLAIEMGVSIRTIQRYLKTLSDQGKIKIQYGVKREIILFKPASMAKPQARGIKKKADPRKSNVTHDTIVASECRVNGAGSTPNVAKCGSNVTHISLSNLSTDLTDYNTGGKIKFPASALAAEPDPFWAELIEEAKKTRAVV